MVTSFSLTPSDEEAIKELKRRYGLTSTSQVIRFALKAALDLEVRPRSLSQPADVIDLSGVEGVSFIDRADPGPQRPAGPGIKQRKTIFENKDGEK